MNKNTRPFLESEVVRIQYLSMVIQIVRFVKVVTMIMPENH